MEVLGKREILNNEDTLNVNIKYQIRTYCDIHEIMCVIHNGLTVVQTLISFLSTPLNH